MSESTDIDWAKQNALREQWHCYILVFHQLPNAFLTKPETFPPSARPAIFG